MKGTRKPDLKKYTNTLIAWYHQQKRDLPWRQSNNPYHIWISEIMLQQTRIEAVKKYYLRFIKEIPNIETLATIEEDKLLKLWEGLGYYSRARNLQKAAKEIMKTANGKFPTTYIEILKLPGIGTYTASAISSICFNEPQVTIDGNVLRVYTRFYNDYSPIDQPITKTRIQKSLLKIVPKESGSFNQALMEIGETICLPNGKPLCSNCPLKQDCLANQKNTIQELPNKSIKQDKKEEKYTVLIYQYQNQLAIYKRTTETLLNNLWAFPTISTHLSLPKLKKYLKENKIIYQEITRGINHTHIFTHKKWLMKSYIIKLTTKENLENLSFIPINTIKSEYAIPTAYKSFLNQISKEE